MILLKDNAKQVNRASMESHSIHNRVAMGSQNLKGKEDESHLLGCKEIS